MKRLIAAWKLHPVITSGFVLALVFTVLFAVRSVVFVIYWSDPGHRDRPLEDWMTPRYVARSWDLPDNVVLDALSLDAMPGRVSLEEIASQQGVSIDELEARIIAAAAAYRASRR